MKTSLFTFTLVLLSFVNLFSQSDTLNQTDNNNCKFGYCKYYKEFKEEKTLIDEGLYVNGRKTGLWKEYYQDGSIRNSLHFLDGRPAGFQILYYDNGDTLECGNFTNGRWIGKYTYYFPNNRRQHVFFFNNKGKRDGCQLYYDKKGDLAREADYNNGKEIYGREFYDDGTIREQITTNIKRNYDKDGCITSIIVYKDERKKDYTETRYYKNGNISEEVTYSDNKRNGMVVTYYDNGNLRLKCAYKNGKMYGKRTYYDYTGKKINNKLVIYNSNHLIEREGFCKNGKPEGEFKVYDSEGNITMLINFKNGKPNGNAYYYYNNKLKSTEVYANGIFVREIGQ